MIVLLLQRGADPNKNKTALYDRTALYVASHDNYFTNNGYTSINYKTALLKLLITYGATGSRTHFNYTDECFNIHELQTEGHQLFNDGQHERAIPKFEEAAELLDQLARNEEENIASAKDKYHDQYAFRDDYRFRTDKCRDMVRTCEEHLAADKSPSESSSPLFESKKTV